MADKQDSEQAASSLNDLPLFDVVPCKPIPHPEGSAKQAPAFQWAILKFETGQQARKFVVKASESSSKVNFLASHTISKLLQASSSYLLDSKTKAVLIAQFPLLPAPSAVGEALATALTTSDVLNARQKESVLAFAGLGPNGDRKEEIASLI